MGCREQCEWIQYVDVDCLVDIERSIKKLSQTLERVIDGIFLCEKVGVTGKHIIIKSVVSNYVDEIGYIYLRTFFRRRSLVTFTIDRSHVFAVEHPIERGSTRPACEGLALAYRVDRHGQVSRYENCGGQSYPCYPYQACHRYEPVRLEPSISLDSVPVISLGEIPVFLRHFFAACCHSDSNIYR